MINLEQLDANIAKEVLVTLMYTDEKILDKIPSDLINNLSTLAADSNIDINFEKGKAIDEQGLSDETINIISVLYYYYVDRFIGAKIVIKPLNFIIICVSNIVIFVLLRDPPIL